MSDTIEQFLRRVNRGDFLYNDREEELIQMLVDDYDGII